MKKRFFRIVVVCCLGGGISLSAQVTPLPLKPVDEHRVREIASWLPPQPAGLGDPCSNRKVWDTLLKSGKYDEFLKEMEQFVFPPFSKEDYFSLFDGSAPSSGRGLNMMRERARGLSKVTWAECLTNDNRYLPLAEAGLRDILDQKSWVSPRNDFDFKNYNGVGYSVELTSALYAHTIAQTLYLLGDRLNPALKKEAVEALFQRVFNPVLDKIRTQNNDRENRFLLMTNNYNHVCLSGVVGAALTVIDDPYQRAVFAYIGEHYAQNGLMGFGDDGYCSEGVGYYNYGFGHYVLLRENIWQATGGKLDLFAIPKVRKIAGYATHLQISEGVFPAISDSHPGAKPDPAMMHYLSRNFQMGLTAYDTMSFEGKINDNRMSVMMVFPNSASLATTGAQEPALPLRSFFEQSAILITRPASGSGLGVVMKGGNNQEHHNHNDVGSYTVALGSQLMAGDPGAIPYTADIFTAEFRYTYKTLASYGHPVPLVDGKTQQTGAKARARVLKKDFTDQTDLLVMDLASAYELPDLKQLTREFIYDRNGRLAVVDRVEFGTPRTFETALITRATVTRLPSGKLLLERENEKLVVAIDSYENSYTLHTEEISEGGVPYTRIGIRLKEPVLKGAVQLLYTVE